MKSRITIVIFSTIFLLVFNSCKNEYVPKPRGYFRIDFPQKEYVYSELNFPYHFEYPSYATLEQDHSTLAEPFWSNIGFPENNAKVHLSYKQVQNNLAKLIEDSRELAYKHTIKATAINEKLFLNPENKVYGTIFQIKGNVASPIQLHLTDSSNHFLRASFYISEIPNYDSLSPVIEFIEEDIHHLIETLSWN